MRITKDIFFEEIERLYSEHGMVNINIFKEYNTLGTKNFRYHVNKYGGIRNILNELNLEYRTYNQPSKEDKLRDLKRVFDSCGDITKSIYEKHGSYSCTCIATDFGWNEIREILGKETYDRNVSVEDVLRDIKEVCEKEDNYSSTFYRKNGKYSQTVIDKYGGWVFLLKSINVKPLNEKFGREYMEECISNLYNEFGFISRELVDLKCDFTYQAVSHLMGGKQGINKFFEKDVFDNSRESTNSKLIHKILVEEFGEEDVLKEHSWKWLLNPKTGYRMYVDYYIKSINLSIEYDGEQHFKHIDYFYRTVEQHNDQLERDVLKDKLLKDNGVNIIRFNFEETINKDSVMRKIMRLMTVSNNV